MVLQLHEYRPLEMVTVQAYIPDELKPRTFLGAPYASPLFDEGFGPKRPAHWEELRQCGELGQRLVREAMRPFDLIDPPEAQTLLY